MKNKFLKNIVLGNFLLGSFAGTFSQLQADRIHAMAARGNVETVAQLLDDGTASIADIDPSGNTPIHFADTPAMIDLLCDRGADPNMISHPLGDTPLHSIINRLRFVEVMSAATEASKAAMIAAKRTQKLECIERLLQIGANKDQTNRAGYSPASIVNQAIQTKMFFDGRLNTPISNGTHSAYTEVQKLFSQVRAKSLHDAVMDDDRVVVRRLLVAGADPNGIDKYGYLPLQCAKTMEMIDLLRRNGADINRPNQWGDPTLRTAVSVPHPDLEYIKQLLLRGADKNTKDGRGRTSVEAVQIAVEDGIVFNSRFNSLGINDEARETYKKVLELFENRGGKAEVYQLPDADTSLSGVEPESTPLQYMPGKVVLKVVKPESTPLQHTPEKVVPEVVEPKSMPSQHTPDSTPGGSVWQSLRPVRQSESERLALPKPSFASASGKTFSTPSQHTPNSTPGGSIWQSLRPVRQSESERLALPKPSFASPKPSFASAGGKTSKRLPSSSASVGGKKSKKGKKAMTGGNQNGNGNTPLHNAVSTNDPNLGLIKALLKMGARTDVENKEGATPWSMVYQAIKNGVAYNGRFISDSKSNEVRKRYIEVLELFKNPPRPRNATVEKNREKSQLQRKRSERQSPSLLY